MRNSQLRKTKWAALLASGGSLLVLDTCNPGVRDTVLGGVEAASAGLVTTFIQAFFEGLAFDEDNNGSIVWAPRPTGDQADLLIFPSV